MKTRARIITATALLFMLFLFIVSYAHADWLTNWQYRKKIIIQNANVVSNLTNFPLYVKINNDTNIGAKAQPDGDDIRFTSSDGTTLLKHEEEYFNVSGGAATGHYWVKIPVIDSSSAVDIYLYYGNADASDGQDAANVWDSSFIVVAHLPNGSVLNAADSTSNANNGAIAGATATAGMIGGGSNHDQQNSISFGSSRNPTNTFTYSGWFKTNYEHEIDMERTGGVSGAWNQRYMFKPNYGEYDAAGSGLSVGINGISVYEHGSNYLPSTAVYVATIGNGWNYVSVVYNNKRPTIYLTGAPVHTGLTSTRNKIYAPTLIGRGDYGDFIGQLDEVRISNIARSSAWLKFEYRNMAEADNELTWGMQEAGGAQPASHSYSKR